MSNMADLNYFLFMSSETNQQDVDIISRNFPEFCDICAGFGQKCSLQMEGDFITCRLNMDRYNHIMIQDLMAFVWKRKGERTVESRVDEVERRLALVENKEEAGSRKRPCLRREGTPMLNSISSSTKYTAPATQAQLNIANMWNRKDLTFEQMASLDPKKTSNEDIPDRRRISDLDILDLETYSLDKCYNHLLDYPEVANKFFGKITNNFSKNIAVECKRHVVTKFIEFLQYPNVPVNKTIMSVMKTLTRLDQHEYLCLYEDELQAICEENNNKHDWKDVVGTIHFMEHVEQGTTYVMCLAIVDKKIAHWHVNSSKRLAFRDLIDRFFTCTTYRSQSCFGKGRLASNLPYHIVTLYQDEGLVHVENEEMYEENEKVITWMKKHFDCTGKKHAKEFFYILPFIYNFCTGMLDPKFLTL